MPNKKLAKKHIIILFFSLFLLLGGLVLAINQSHVRTNTQSHAASNCDVSTDQIATKAQEQQLFDLINQYRTANGKGVLAWSPAIKRPAIWLSHDMLTTRNLSHTDSLGRTPDKRLPDCDFPVTVAYGENIATGTPNAQAIFNAWKNSPPHNTNMLDTEFTQAAVGMDMDSSGTISYWTLDLAGSVNVVTPSVQVTSLPTSPLTTLTPVASITLGPSVTVNPSGSLTPTGSDSITPSTTISQKPGRDPTPTTGPVGVDIQIQVKVKILGIGADGNKSPHNLTRKVTAEVWGTGKDPVATGNGFLTYDNQNYFVGVIHLGKMTQGAYFIKLSTENSLKTLARPEFQNLMINQVNTIPSVILYQGDINQDNVIDIKDYNAVLPCFQNKRCDTKAQIDFNDDGLTDVKDYNLLLRSFGQQPGN